MSSEVRSAEWALHRRAASACVAAREAAVAGDFHAWEQEGVLAVSVTDSSLDFLSTLSGIGRETVPVAIDLVRRSVRNGVRPTVVVSTELGEEMETALRAGGLVRAGDRLLALRRLDTTPGSTSGADQGVVPVAGNGAALDAFLAILLAGYGVDGVVAAFIEAEHRLPIMRRFLVLERTVPIAAAAMTIHGEVAVLGGASTLREYRGRGAQSRLLRHRLRVAAEAGCGLAVATAGPESVSAANLRRAGFRLHRRSAWTRA
ncbi:GNAT family N-acetyltransferase [Amycolatopsis cihanbeyliensis]|uniref:N-acetyltransferase domain-containing protein n=1 Tax=Amycolatopsis cihanbeyliensis TaxID=1128664 RepID=A0A542DC01_AMYCI|nr:GNAT family N-acetyltransferase [Amycolatopsis cihanbeyliensis]TQJ00596.1 hypothetical protein FB471_0230 [Amycolatopsis cihanbeyliensis]